MKLKTREQIQAEDNALMAEQKAIATAVSKQEQQRRENEAETVANKARVIAWANQFPQTK